ncbi:hypothetical protein HanIR_Chr10g0484521 [Helianthus annuus]|nr:hypothetical protein HanIR_Chr10g0484521 [Helianthus annuus]
MIAVQVNLSLFGILLKISTALPTSPHLKYMSISAFPTKTSFLILFLSIQTLTHLPNSSAPVLAQAVRMLTMVNSSGSTFASCMFLKSIKASLNRFCFTYPSIIAVHETESLTGISSNNSRARSSFPILRNPDNIAVQEITSLAFMFLKTDNAASISPHAAYASTKALFNTKFGSILPS